MLLLAIPFRSCVSITEVALGVPAPAEDGLCWLPPFRPYDIECLHILISTPFHDLKTSQTLHYSF